MIKSTNEHGIHSPFVYNFLTLCLYKPRHNFRKRFEQIRLNLDTNNQTIDVEDYGAGSKKNKSNKRTISSISKNAGISNKRGELLYNIAQYFKPEKVLEIGTSLGLATSCLSIGNPLAQIFTLEGCPNTAKVAEDYLKKANCDNVEIIIGEFKNTLPNILKNITFDLIYFDGNHKMEPTIDYFKKAVNNTKNNSVFIFDDIHWNSEMEQAWNYIKNHNKVTISIDTFQWGIVFFRKEQFKQHFTIRI